MRPVPGDRIRVENDRPLRPGGAFVVYWMVAARRVRFNFALDRAVAVAAELKRPLLVLEALRCDYPYASDRLHRFILEGMTDNAADLEGTGVGYLPYVEPERGAGKGLLAALANEACVVVTDRFPAFFLPRMLQAAARRLPVRLESVDGCGLLPLAAAPKAFARAHDFRRYLRRALPEHLGRMPKARPFAGVALPPLGRLPPGIRTRWPAATATVLEGRTLAGLPLDHTVAPVPLEGGSRAGRRGLRRFLDRGLPIYADASRHPDAEATSGLSPYLHFGHLGPHEILDALWRLLGVGPKGFGADEDDPFGLGPDAGAFLDQLVTWRELGYNFCAFRDDADAYDGLPAWARDTLAAHRRDRRPHHYDLSTLAEARTDDLLWNAAQRELLATGRIHNSLRMLWGKRVLEWTAEPEEAFDVLVHLNDTYAIDGRDPNSYNGIGWVFGRYDRTWPERPIFGKVRIMTSASTGRKLRLARWLERYGDPATRSSQVVPSGTGS